MKSDSAVLAAVVLSDSLWRSRFGADASVIGRSLVLGGTPEGGGHHAALVSLPRRRHRGMDTGAGARGTAQCPAGEVLLGWEG